MQVEVELVSRRHAWLTVNYDHGLIEDLGSSNGIFVNGKPVTKSTRLWPNQKIQIGAATIDLRRLKAIPPPHVSLAPSAATVRRLLPENLLWKKIYDIGGVVAQGGMGVIHRNLKPENIMLGDLDEVLLMDWGLAEAKPARAAEDWADILAKVTPAIVTETSNGWRMDDGALFSPAKSYSSLPPPGDLSGTSYQARVNLRQFRQTPPSTLALATYAADWVVYEVKVKRAGGGRFGGTPAAHG